MPAKTRHVEDILRILLAHYKSKFIGGVGGAFVTNCSVNMAVATGVSFSESDIHEILVEVEKIPCFEKDKTFHYKVSASNIVANLTCSSSFEAATKFGFLLVHVGSFSFSSKNSTPDCSPVEVVCECEENGEITVYLVGLGNNRTPHVSLLKIEVKAKDDSSDDTQPEPFDAVYI